MPSPVSVHSIESRWPVVLTILVVLVGLYHRFGHRGASRPGEELAKTWGYRTIRNRFMSEGPVGVTWLHQMGIAAHVVMSQVGACGVGLICQFLHLSGLSALV